MARFSIGFRRWVATWLLACVAIVCASPSLVRAELPIELEVAVVQAAPFGAMQEWGKALSELNLAGVRLRGANADDKPSITPVGSGASQRFKVVGVLNHRDQLVVPGFVFGAGDRTAMKDFFESLPGREAGKGIVRGAFGLTKPQFAKVFEEFSAPVTVSTKGAGTKAALAAIFDGISLPVEMDVAASGALRRATPQTAELRGLSRGAAAAILLRSAGLAIAPEQKGSEPLKLRVVEAKPGAEYWPTGWKPNGPPRQAAPQMYKFTTIEISGYTLAEALTALEPHTGVPLVMDERLLAAKGIDPTKIDVELPGGKTYIGKAVSRILSQARLAGEVRVDENGKAFYWVTQFGPDSPRAIGEDVTRKDVETRR